MRNILLVAGAALALGGCMPSFDQVKAAPVREEFVLDGSTECVYENALQALATMSADGLAFQSYIAKDQQSAWIQRGFALVEMRQDGSKTLVSRRSVRNTLPSSTMPPVMSALRANPCASA